jgi:hypothetical protein
MKLKKERSCPTVVCDFCGEEIEDARDGNCQWRMGEEQAGPGATLYFTHKTCCHSFESANPGSDWGAQELDHFMVYLSNNTKLDWQNARKSVQLLASLG